MMKYHTGVFSSCVLLCLTIFAKIVHSDDFGIDKVYIPYVQPVEKNLNIVFCG